MRVLLIALYYPPLNSISSLRMKGFVDQMRRKGIEVDVITRHYDEEQIQGKSMFVASRKAKNFSGEYQITNGNTIYTNYDEDTQAARIFRRLPPGIKGLYAYYKVDIYHYGWLRYVTNAYKNEFSKNKYDFIIASYGPPIALLAARRISRLAKVPWIADFRDIYIDERDRNLQLTAKKMVQNYLLKDAAALIFTTDGMHEYFDAHASKALQKKPSVVVYNGVDDHGDISEYDKADQPVIDEFNRIRCSHYRTLLHTGTLYAGQNINFFVDAVTRFNSSNDDKIALIFVGLAENDFNLVVPGENIYILDKVKHSTSLYLQRRADALVLPIWDGRYTGFSGKTFEYLHAGTTVFCGPDPQRDLYKFFQASGKVFILQDYTEFANAVRSNTSRNSAETYSSPEIFTRSYWVNSLIDFIYTLNTSFTSRAGIR